MDLGMRNLLTMVELDFESIEEVLTAIEIAEDPNGDTRMRYPEYDIECQVIICEDDTYALEICIYGEEQR